MEAGRHTLLEPACSSHQQTQPEIATIGFSEKEIKENAIKAETFKLPLHSNPRAKIMGIKHGFVKIFANADSGATLGAVIVAPNASELILPLAIAVENRLTVDNIADTFPVYPSLSGAITDAARALHKTE